MIEPKPEDHYRKVLYTPTGEQGIITSYNESFVFVRYAHQDPLANGQATRREDLEWVVSLDSDEEET